MSYRGNLDESVFEIMMWTIKYGPYYNIVDISVQYGIVSIMISNALSPISLYKVNNPLKVLAIGLTETYSHMAPWHVIMGQSFGASITYQLDAGKFLELHRVFY